MSDQPLTGHPVVANERRRPTPLQIVFIAAIAAFVLLSVVAVSNSGTNAVDTWINHWILAHRSAASIHVAAFVTRAGMTVVVVPAVFLGAMVAGSGAGRQRLQTAGLAVLVIASGLVLRLAIADVVARTRPAPTGWAAGASGYAFPSGHTTGATLAAGLLAWLILRERSRRPATRMFVCGLAVACAVAVGITRVWLGVHWPTDVMGGWAFGLAWASLGVLAMQRFSPTRR